MKSKTTIEKSPLDTVKLAVAIALLVAGIGLFYYYEEVSQLYRVVGLLAVAAVAVAIAATSAVGRGLIGFGRDARTELRKVVWPTRQETVQTTLVVVVMVLVVAIFLWLLDMILFEGFGWLMDLGG